MISFDAAHKAVHYPSDRRFRIWINPSILIGTGIAIVAAIAAAWIEVAAFGMPHIPPVPQLDPTTLTGPHGFPGWVRYSRFFNFFFVMILIRSGLSILADHPRLYFNDDCTPGSEWIRFTKHFAGRQAARSIHFLTMLGFLAFLVVHLTLIVLTGFARNMNHIVLGTDDQGAMGMLLGFAGIGVVILSWVAAHYLSWFQPRRLQHALKSVTNPMQLLTLNRLAPRQRYSEGQISPYFWPNGKMPIRDDWKRMAEGGFAEFRLKVGGLVERPAELSLTDLESMSATEHITMHHWHSSRSGAAFQ